MTQTEKVNRGVLLSGGDECHVRVMLYPVILVYRVTACHYYRGPKLNG